LPSHSRAALAAARTRLARVVAVLVARVPALEPPFVRLCRWSARRSRLVFGLCWAVNTRLNELLPNLGRQYRQLDVGPLRLWLDVADQSGFGLHFYGDPYEPLLTAELFKQLREDDVFVDIGANAGLFSLIAARIVGGKGRVIAFEPHPGARGQMTRLLERNDVANRVDIVDAALSDQPASGVPLHLSFRSSLSTLDPSAAPGRRDFAYTDTVLVDVTTLDDWMAHHADLTPRIAVIKIDVEGVEERVVAGMMRTLRAAPKARVICETAPNSTADHLLLATGFEAISLEAAQGSYVGNRLYTRRELPYE
jgi:FkbM family methyltransferase